MTAAHYATSIADLNDFPFASFEEFCEAHRERRARVWVRFDFQSAWRFTEPGERFVMATLVWLGLAACPLFALLAALTRDPWWLCGAAAALLAQVFASPAPGILSGGGCIALPMFAGGVVGSVFLDRSLVWCGMAGFAIWFIVSAGQGVGDATIREAMLKSEENLLFLFRRGAIVRVEDAGPPQEV